MTINFKYFTSRILISGFIVSAVLATALCPLSNIAVATPLAQEESEQTETSNPAEDPGASQEEEMFENVVDPNQDQDLQAAGGANDQQTRPGTMPRRPRENPQEEEEWVPAEPEVVTLEASDHVILQCDFYAGKPGKMTVPVILVHAFGRSRSDMTFLALHLQRNHGHSVIVPDLRGHGESVRVVDVDETIDLEEFGAAEFLTIVNDIERCKKFMMTKNNAGQANIELLTVVTAGNTAIPAVNWCISDWSWQTVNGRKQGQDVKAICMISPERRFKSASLSGAIREPLFTGAGIDRPIAVQLVWSEEDEDGVKDGAAIQSSLERSRRRLEKKYMKVVQPYGGGDSASQLVGNEANELVFQDVSDFIELAILRRVESLPWQNRAKPEEEQ